MKVFVFISNMEEEESFPIQIITKTLWHCQRVLSVSVN